MSKVTKMSEGDYYYCEDCKDHVRKCDHGSDNNVFPRIFPGKHGDFFCGHCGLVVTDVCDNCPGLVSKKRKVTHDKCTTCDGTGQVNVEVVLEEVLEEEPEQNICIICCDNIADTLVVPCLHSTVCSVCSEKLKDTGDRYKCVRCRCPITGIYFNDNTTETI